jgi:hypothetical protein
MGLYDYHNNRLYKPDYHMDYKPLIPPWPPQVTTLRHRTENRGRCRGAGEAGEGVKSLAR